MKGFEDAGAVSRGVTVAIKVLVCFRMPEDWGNQTTYLLVRVLRYKIILSFLEDLVSASPYQTGMTGGWCSLIPLSPSQALLPMVLLRKPFIKWFCFKILILLF